MSAWNGAPRIRDWVQQSGTITGTRLSMRQMQLALKYVF
jgi:hypothetical protein